VVGEQRAGHNRGERQQHNRGTRAAAKKQQAHADSNRKSSRRPDQLEALALFAPGQAAPYVGAEGLRTAIREAQTAVTGGSADAG
jgi:hypothetical protein